MTTTSNSPAVYVGTYAKYNNGSLEGAWLTLDDYTSKEAFIEACLELHKDESDPELMFQDWENDPGDFISESEVKDELWEYLQVVSDWDDDRKEALQDWLKNGSGEITDIDRFEEQYQGKFDSKQAYAEDYADQTGMLDSIPENLRFYFDFEKFARDMFISDCWMSENGHVFLNH